MNLYDLRILFQSQGEGNMIANFHSKFINIQAYNNKNLNVNHSFNINTILTYTDFVLSILLHIGNRIYCKNLAACATQI